MTVQPTCLICGAPVTNVGMCTRDKRHTHPDQVKNPTGNDGTGTGAGAGYYIRTFTGKKFYWDRIEENEFDIRDIAHALAMNCRWTGHTQHFYSVAQHSVYASMEAPPGLELSALLHDASEAYCHDTPSPLKWYLAEHDFTVFSDLEKRIDAAIYKKFKLAYPRDPVIKQIDLRLLATENRDLMPHGEERMHMIAPYDWKIRPLDPTEAENLFLRRYNRIWRNNNAAKLAA